jgi:RimJ/RimL family protein N-acetyltransferase
VSEQRVLQLRPDVQLAPLSVEHAERMYRWMCDPEVSKNIGLRSEPSLEKTISWIHNQLQDTHSRPFAVLLQNDHVGNVVLDQIDSYLESARLSIYIGEPTARRSGVGLTAIYQALFEGFMQDNLYKIWLTVHTRNFAAIKTYSRLGFQLEGILRDDFWIDGERVSALYMGILRQDFARVLTIKKVRT